MMYRTYIFILILILTYSPQAIGQNKSICMSTLDSLTKMVIYTSPEQLAEPRDGMPALFKSISKQLTLSTTPTDLTESKVLVSFVVTVEGKITGQRVLKNIQNTDAAEQVLNIISNYKWTPGLCNNQIVSSILTIPVLIHFSN